jgi:hypothetical protein
MRGCKGLVWITTVVKLNGTYHAPIIGKNIPTRSPEENIVLVSRIRGGRESHQVNYHIFSRTFENRKSVIIRSHSSAETSMGKLALPEGPMHRFTDRVDSIRCFGYYKECTAYATRKGTVAGIRGHRRYIEYERKQTENRCSSFQVFLPSQKGIYLFLEALFNCSGKVIFGNNSSHL